MNTTRQQQVEAAVKWIEEAWREGALSQSGQGFIGQLEEAFTDRQYEVDDVMVQGEEVIARIVITGKHTGTFAGNPATGRMVRITQFHEFTVNDGRIVHRFGWYDTGTLLPQLQAGA
ncbi:putative ester cyclase [Paenibacillus rhizosphaerae]|uniref:Putative ester cyclase n=1 Tax=Paenibacillus rhizosphaerae TaxID=297318 RepID=A0A839TYG3_9BACL|nr:ester cyclase [Paenibacillus rhizosphaerae]MBB3130600.1 putative ester cyclase [Paenibacillus rhizosphaerae]